jgi:hypothetical protein
MAEKIPLNLFKRVTEPVLRNTKKQIYVVPNDRAAIFISSIATNTANYDTTLTFSISTQTPDKDHIFVKQTQLDKGEIKNIAVSKLVLVEGDIVNTTGDISDLRTIDDPNAFWEFELPNTITTLSGLQVSYTTSVLVTADWGVGNLSNTPTTQTLLTNNIPTDYTYNLTNNTGINMTISILETINTP